MATTLRRLSCRPAVEALSFQVVGIDEAGEQHSNQKGPREPNFAMLLEPDSGDDIGRQWWDHLIPTVIARYAVISTESSLKSVPIHETCVVPGDDVRQKAADRIGIRPFCNACAGRRVIRPAQSFLTACGAGYVVEELIGIFADIVK
jgi:hypothetical protein